MSEFSSTDAALEGLRVSREHPVAVLWWWGANVAATLLQFVIALQPPFRRLNEVLVKLQDQMAAAQNGGSFVLDAQDRVALQGVALPLVIWVAITLMLMAVVRAAVLRAVLRPAESRFGFLRISMDELRQVGLTLYSGLVLIIYVGLVAIASALVLAILLGLTGSGAGVFAGAAVLTTITVAVLYPAVRLSLAPAMTLADGRISLFRSWPLTVRCFWPMVGAYLVSWIIGFAVVGSSWAIWRLIAFILTHSLTPPDPQTLRDLLAPLPLVTIVINGLFNALLSAIIVAPTAAIFRQLTGRVGAAAPAKSHSGSPWGQA